MNVTKCAAVTLELDAEEAMLLKYIAGWDATIPGAICKSDFSKREQVKEFLNTLYMQLR